MPSFPERATVREVGLRDGLQSIRTVLPTERKKAWIRAAQLRTHFEREVGEEWWASPQTGDHLRELFREGTKPTSEEIAARLGFDPLDTKPLLHEIGA